MAEAAGGGQVDLSLADHPSLQYQPYGMVGAIAADAIADHDSSSSAKTGSVAIAAAGSSPLDATWIKGALTLNDVERDQGRPLSKYMRNMMIFNWLHSLEDGPSELL